VGVLGFVDANCFERFGLGVVGLVGVTSSCCGSGAVSAEGGDLRFLLVGAVLLALVLTFVLKSLLLG
jgi:hypothetical protein